MKQRNQTLRRKTMERDDFTCQKCKIQDKTGRILEIHHITPLYVDGKDELNNLITLCNDCHHFAPNKEDEFKEYMKEEMDGTSTTLIKAWKKVLKDNPELIEKINKEKS
ncbi:MAG TPA: HNH endonuclease [Candidatus Pacearchaeota archaeon]|nr:HNH endonuclease [Candidatus Pacearchaeota archaeon]